MPKYTVTVAIDDGLSDYEVLANDPVEACKIAYEHVEVEGFSADEYYEDCETFGQRVECILDADGNEVEVPLEFTSESNQQERLIADLKAEITRLKFKCGEA